MQVGQTILSVCKGVAQWKNVGKQAKQAVQQEVVKELAKTVRQACKFTFFLLLLFFRWRRKSPRNCTTPSRPSLL